MIKVEFRNDQIKWGIVGGEETLIRERIEITYLARYLLCKLAGDLDVYA